MSNSFSHEMKTNMDTMMMMMELYIASYIHNCSMCMKIIISMTNWMMMKKMTKKIVTRCAR